MFTSFCCLVITHNFVNSFFFKYTYIRETDLLRGIVRKQSKLLRKKLHLKKEKLHESELPEKQTLFQSTCCLVKMSNSQRLCIMIMVKLAGNLILVHIISLCLDTFAVLRSSIFGPISCFMKVLTKNYSYLLRPMASSGTVLH